MKTTGEEVRVLLVDDEPGNLNALETILEPGDYTLVRAQSADEALLAVLSNDFAAIVLDIKMPGTSGLELAQLIKSRRHSQHVPILFLTAHSLDESDVLQAYDVGGVDFLTKPINPEILRSKVAVFANLFRTTRALASAVEALNAEVTERQKIQEELRLAKDDLETRVQERTADLAQAKDALMESDRRKDEFLATLAHELRNPLAPIRYAVTMLDMKGPSLPELRWAIELIERQARHMSRLIDDLLDVNRIRRNALSLRRETVELAKVIEAAVEASKPMIEQNRQELVVRAPATPIYLNADFVRLAQVFSNLLNNAAKYSRRPDGGGEIGLSFRQSGGEAVVTVTDTGIGIPPADLPQVFDMFTQVGRAAGHPEGGLGIGLALSKRLVEMHGGVIEARSEGAGLGSEFTVRLPVPARLSGRVPSHAEPLDRNYGMAKRRILVADDNPDVLESFQLMLEVLGHEVETAVDGLDALEKAERFMPEVVALDIGMPKVDGLEVARRLRERAWAGDTVMIAITGWGNDKDRLKSMEAGFDGHFVKPIDAMEFMSIVEKLHEARAVREVG